MHKINSSIMKLNCLITSSCLTSLLASAVFLTWGITANAHGQRYMSGHKVACFSANDFPTIDAPAIDAKTLKDALKEFDIEYLSLESLNANLTVEKFRALVLPYGSAFPAEGWQKIHDFISHGGSIVVLGGYPFHQPILEDHGTWIPGTPQPTYAHQLLIGPADTITLSSSPFYQKNSRMISPEGSDFDTRMFQFPTKVYELTVRFTTSNDFPDEIGSAGPRNAVLRPLVQIVNGDDVPVACPLIEIDRMGGGDAGGRWIIEPSDARLNAPTIKFCVERALEGAASIEAFPVQACVDKGEIPLIRINQFRPNPDQGDQDSAEIGVLVSDSSGRSVFKSTSKLTGTREFLTGEVPVDTKMPLQPGFYKVDLKNIDVSWHPNSFTTGFWVMDRDILDSGPHLSVSKDWLLKNGAVFPVIGTSYMAGNAGRKFLLEPNPYLWEKDFLQMERQGINFVRTGFWTGWRKAMLDPGTVDEGFLRALDALLLTAARHNIVICFNLFAFLPPMNGGTNPYLDRRALEWQKTFTTLIASRYRNVGWVNYDLINEPSYSPNDKIWQEIPIGDEYERSAWKDWVQKNHKNQSAGEILDDWRDGSQDMSSLPDADELSYEKIREDRRPRKALDFQLFAQGVLTNWAEELRNIIHTAGGDALVTLGQDEGGMSRRSSQQFHYASVDYTSIHTWWLNDNLLWDVVSAKVPEKPNLVEETGLMRLENIDGEPLRSPANAEKLLERKFAYAFQGKSAGVVEWCWNINEYQSTDNEVSIGLTRADGTMKIETEVIRQFADFFRRAQPYLGDYQKDSLVLVIPDSKLFSGFPNALDGVQRFVRILSDDFGLVPTLLSEFRLSDERLSGAKLIIVPDPGMICDSAAVELFKASRNGTKILFTGAVEGNEYGKLTKQFEMLGLNSKCVPVSHYEPTNWKLDAERPINLVTFGSGKSEYLMESAKPFLDTLKGNILNEPLPLEMADEKEPVMAMLNAVLNYSGIVPQISNTPVASRVLVTDKAALIICVNESSIDLKREVSVDGHKFEIPVDAGRSRLVLCDRVSGELVIATEGRPVIRLE